MRGFSPVIESGWKFHTPAHTAGTQTQPDIVWLHGWGQTGESLLPLARLFSHQAHNHVPDLPGFGQTPMLHEGASSADYADALYQVLNKLGIGTRRPVLIGHSFGARVAIRFAARYPESLGGIVLIAGAGLKRRRSLGFRLRAQALRMVGKSARLLDSLFKSNLQTAFRTRFGSADYRNAGLLRGTLVSVVNEDLTEQAQQVNVPTLLIYGAEDDATPPEFGERYKSLIPDATLHVLQGFGHLDVLNRGAWQCQSLIEGFLERIKP